MWQDICTFFPEDILWDSLQYMYCIVPPTEYTECWPGTLFDILLIKYFPAG